ncbi:hypothetical protein GLYMA_06G141801v4 [Glycine max]|nr:hypothetical protein GLYMA_06G141801v4 [Glycine max]KAG4389710.1 hypothetical protein GLYMA_06G141801v4 [Glycine max]KAG4389713.1 hypothetical protein GLYMA_06G141801v4 [Glycine max]KAH1125848.1 hypothetical protein GYH30_015070 [Glycine max]KAH1125849.1 hypothetical protein GYH30_015070 [Glycine max]
MIITMVTGAHRFSVCPTKEAQSLSRFHHERCSREIPKYSLADGKDKTTSPTLLLALLVFSTTWDDRNREVVWCFCLYQSPLLEEYDMHDRKDPLSVVLLFLRKRSKIIEILAAQEIVLALDNRVFVQHLTERPIKGYAF